MGLFLFSIFFQLCYCVSSCSNAMGEGNSSRGSNTDSCSRYVRVISAEPICHLTFAATGGSVLYITSPDSTDLCHKGLVIFLHPVVAKTSVSSHLPLKVWNIGPQEYDQLQKRNKEGKKTPPYNVLKVKLLFCDGHDPFTTATDEGRGKHNKVFYESTAAVTVGGGVGYTRLTKASDIETLFPRCRGFVRVSDAVFHKIAVANRRHSKRWSFFSTNRQLVMDMKFDETVKPSDLVERYGALAETLCFRVNTRNMGPHSGTGQGKHCTSSVFLQTMAPLKQLVMPHDLKIGRVLEQEEQDDEITTKAVLSFFRGVDTRKISAANALSSSSSSIFHNISPNVGQKSLRF